MKRDWSSWLALAACTVLSWAGTQASTADLYNTKPVKGDVVAMPTPPEGASLAGQPAGTTLTREHRRARLPAAGGAGPRPAAVRGCAREQRPAAQGEGRHGPCRRQAHGSRFR